MEEYRRGAHSVYDIKYHLIWITKYRYKVLRGRVAERVRDLIRQSCEARGVAVIRGAVSPDHVHMLVTAPPQLAPSKLVQYLKGRSSRRLQDEFGELRKRYWGQHLWARGYFCATVGAVDEETIKRYIESRNGMRTGKDSRLQRPPSLEPAVSRTASGGLSRNPDFQSKRNPPPFRRWMFSRARLSHFTVLCAYGTTLHEKHSSGSSFVFQ